MLSCFSLWINWLQASILIIISISSRDISSCIFSVLQVVCCKPFAFLSLTVNVLLSHFFWIYHVNSHNTLFVVVRRFLKSTLVPIPFLIINFCNLYPCVLEGTFLFWTIHIKTNLLDNDFNPTNDNSGSEQLLSE